MNDNRAGGRIVRDMERFKLLFTNSRAEIVDDSEVKLGNANTRALIGARVRALRANRNATSARDAK